MVPELMMAPVVRLHRALYWLGLTGCLMMGALR